METSEISLHQVRIYRFVAQHKGWITAKEIAGGANVGDRTARSHALRFVRLGIFDQAEVFPAHRYRLSELAGKRNKAFLQRLDEAAEILKDQL